MSDFMKAATSESSAAVEYDLMTTAETADLTRLSVETLRWFRHTGRGPRSFKLGRRVMYAREDVEQWIAAARESGGAA